MNSPLESAHGGHMDNDNIDNTNRLCLSPYANTEHQQQQQHQQQHAQKQQQQKQQQRVREEQQRLATNDGARRPTGYEAFVPLRTLFSRQFWSTRRNRLLTKSYALDWVLMLCLFIGSQLIDLIYPFKRYWFPNDESLAYPLVLNQTVPPWALFVICLGIPIVVIVFVSVLLRKSPHDLHHGLLGLFVALAMAAFVTQVIKTSVGRLRPDFIARCWPVGTDYSRPLPGVQGSIPAIIECGNPDDGVVKEGRKSFPSGHSSLSFAGLTFLSLYLAGKMHSFGNHGYVFSFILPILPITGAALVGISRINDYWHHWSDVVVGGALGFLIAVFVYYRYYPPLMSLASAVPMADRIVLLTSPSPATPSSPLTPTQYPYHVGLQQQLEPINRVAPVPNDGHQEMAVPGEVRINFGPN